jgi:HK97 family phage major capsid protein
MTLDQLVAEVNRITAAFKNGSASAEDLGKLPELTQQIETAQKSQADVERGEEMIRRLGQPGGAKRANEGEGEKRARSLGEHLAKHLGQIDAKNGSRIAFATPEFKAASDPLVTGGVEAGLVDVDVQRRVIPDQYWRPTVASLFAQGTINGTALKYFKETPVEGDFAAVSELGLKPQLSMGYEPVTEGLAKIAGRIKESDEFIEDLGFLASVTNGRLLQKLAQAEEAQLVNGSGTSPNLRGLLNRSGLQTIAAGASIMENVENLFRAAMRVQNVTGLVADGIVINPADYERIRLSRDGNEQFYGGGPFMGQYGVGGQALTPPLWNLPTIVTAAVPVGTAVVGAFGTAAMLFRKGGVRVELANQNEDDFNYNRITIRAEERIGLAVYRPDAFVSVGMFAPA